MRPFGDVTIYDVEGRCDLEVTFSETESIAEITFNSPLISATCK